jgi:hypothetical protein
MHLNAKMGAVVGQALEETTNMLTEALTLRHLSTYGVVSIEEATFYRNLSSTVITEAAEDFIPDEVETADIPDGGDAIELYDAAGNCYLFDPNTGSLTPCDAPAGDDVPAEEAAVDAAPVAESCGPVQESTELGEGQPVESGEAPAEQAPVIEESTITAVAQNRISKILANIK